MLFRLEEIIAYAMCTVFCGTSIIMRNIPLFKLNVGIFHTILSIMYNIVMDPGNVITLLEAKNKQQTH